MIGYTVITLVVYLATSTVFTYMWPKREGSS
jgi:hypothetical protein